MSGETGDEAMTESDDALKDVDIQSGGETPAPQSGEMDNPEEGSEGGVGDGTGEGHSGPASG